MLEIITKTLNLLKNGTNDVAEKLNQESTISVGV
jgi:hypothetical protein